MKKKNILRSLQLSVIKKNIHITKIFVIENNSNTTDTKKQFLSKKSKKALSNEDDMINFPLYINKIPRMQDVLNDPQPTLICCKLNYVLIKKILNFYLFKKNYKNLETIKTVLSMFLGISLNKTIKLCNFKIDN